MCPHCAGKDKASCKECNGTGYIEVTFAKGEMYHVVCTNACCQFYNGGFIVGGGSPFKTLEDRGDPPLCIKCQSPTEYEKG